MLFNVTLYKKIPIIKQKFKLVMNACLSKEYVRNFTWIFCDFMLFIIRPG